MLNKRIDFLTSGGNPMTLLGSPVKVGEKAPDFTAIKNDLTPFTLAEVSNQIKLISAVPSIDTEVCQIQTIRFIQAVEELPDVVVLTISADLPFAQSCFCRLNGQAYHLKNMITLSDHKDLDFGLQYGLVIEELRLLSRSIMVVDHNNIIQHVEYVRELAHHVDYDAALSALKKCLAAL